MVFLAKKGVELATAEKFIGYPADEWTDEHLDAIKKWAKAGFPVFPSKPASPDLAGEEIVAPPSQDTHPEEKTPPEATTESQGPDLGDILTQLGNNGWPLNKLEIRFGKKAKEWGHDELSALADMAADL
jgi:hypothetical protein